MCVIIDTNALGQVFQTTPDASPGADAAAFMHARVRDGTVQMAWGLCPRRREYRLEGLVARLHQARLVKLYKTDDLAEEARRLREKAGNRIRSDDETVLAIACLSGARLLVSHDGDLCDDFRDREILTPKGKRYPLHRLPDPTPLRESHRTLVDQDHRGCCD